MKWYQTLFVKVFIASWMICVLLMGGLVYGVLRAKEIHHWQALIEARALGYAQLIVERSERESGRGHEGDRTRGRFPIRVIDLAQDRLLHDFRQTETVPDLMQWEWVAENGKAYRIEIPKPQEPMHLERMLRFLLSVQMALILIVSMLISLLVSIWVIKPINRLKSFTRALHDEQNLSCRTDHQLSTRQDEIGALAREFNQMAGYVERTLQAREQLLRDVSHELRAPLARLQVATGILEQQMPNSENRFLAQIHQESAHLAQLIDQLLSLSRLDDLSVSAVEPYCLNDFLVGLVQQYQLQYPNHDMTTCLSPERLKVAINQDLLTRIVGNVLENALKYSPEKSCVSLTAEQQGEQLVITCADQGRGVAAHQLESIFEPFYRLNETQAGYGLGLSIVRSAVSRLQGKITATNREGGGLVLQIQLPNPIGSIA